MRYERAATRQVLEALAWSPVVLVEGPRQAGKTVLVRDLVGAHRPAAYRTLDDAQTLAIAREDPQGFVLGQPDPVVLDEVQRLPEMFRAIKLSVDRDRRPGRFLLTGSANVLALPRLSDSLAGRMAIVNIWPLSQGEIDGAPDDFVATVFGEADLKWWPASQTRADLVARLTRGGFPPAVSIAAASTREGWLRHYATTVLERDVRDVSAVPDRVALPRVLRMLAARSGSVLNVSDFARFAGLPRTSLDRYLALFAVIFTLRLVPAWSGDVARRLVRAPKVLFVDSGLAAHLVGCDARRLLDDPDQLGPLLETFVGGELVRQVDRCAQRIELLHYRDASGAEVDWVLEDPRGRLVGIEVKATTAPTARDFRGLKAFAAQVGERFHRGILLHTGEHAVPMGERVWALPIEALWRLGEVGASGLGTGASR